MKSGIRITGGLRFRIMLPAVIFVLIFSLFFILLTNHYTSKLLDQRLEREAVRISNILYESRFVLNPLYLDRLGAVIEGRIALFDSSGSILAASFNEAGTRDFLEYVNPTEIQTRHDPGSQTPLIHKINKKNRSFLLVSQKIFFPDANENILIAILTPLDDLQTIKSQTALRTILSGSLALLVAFIVAGLVLKKITASVQDILHVTDKIASGDFSSKADLSDIHELETLALSINLMSNKLMEYEKQLVDTTQLKSVNQITAAMAHEIKNPLSSMKMLAQMIQKRLKNDREGAEMAAAFIKEINRVDHLVSDLKTFSGTARVSFSLTLPRKPLEEVIVLIKPKLDHLHISFELHMDPDIPEIWMDKDKIKQVLWNLMMNGVESMPAGGRLRVCLKWSQKPDCIEYTVEDSGSGIDPKDLDHIFTPFFTTKTQGIGIGLHVSQEIALAHQGVIQIIPATQGTLAVLLLPCHQDEEMP